MSIKLEDNSANLWILLITDFLTCPYMKSFAGRKFQITSVD